MSLLNEYEKRMIGIVGNEPSDPEKNMMGRIQRLRQALTAIASGELPSGCRVDVSTSVFAHRVLDSDDKDAR